MTKKVGFELRACLNVVMNMTAEEAEIGGGGGVCGGGRGAAKSTA